MRSSDTFNLKITAAFITPQGNTYYAVDNQPAFEYVMYHGNRYHTGTRLRPEILDWLFNRKNQTRFDLFDDTKQILKRVEFDKEMTVDVFYSSTHHIDER